MGDQIFMGISRRSRTPIPAADNELGISGLADVVWVGSGSAGPVYRARVISGDRVVAIKVFDALTAHASSWFEHNAATLHGIAGQQGIAGIESWGITSAGDPYWVTAFLNRGTLAAAIRRNGIISAAEVMNLGARLADALAIAHAAGIAHGDVRPANVMFDEAGQASIADFALRDSEGIVGVARAMNFAAPEAVADTALLSPQADQYSLALTLWSAAAGGSPWSNIATRDLAALPSTVPAELRAILTRALSAKPGDRFTSLSDFAQHLRMRTAPAAHVNAEHPAEPPTQAADDSGRWMPPSIEDYQSAAQLGYIDDSTLAAAGSGEAAREPVSIPDVDLSSPAAARRGAVSFERPAVGNRRVPEAQPVVRPVPTPVPVPNDVPALVAAPESAVQAEEPAAVGPTVTWPEPAGIAAADSPRLEPATTQLIVEPVPEAVRAKRGMTRGAFIAAACLAGLALAGGAVAAGMSKAGSEPVAERNAPSAPAPGTASNLPTPITDLKAELSGDETKVVLTWTDPLGGTGSYMPLKWTTTSATGSKFDTSMIDIRTVPGETSHAIGGLTPGTGYCFALRLRTSEAVLMSNSVHVNGGVCPPGNFASASPRPAPTQTSSSPVPSSPASETPAPPVPAPAPSSSAAAPSAKPPVPSEDDPFNMPASYRGTKESQ